MARKTQISKEIILQAALEMLIEKGYQEINIKTLSQKIGCSTQPLVWHFGNMEGLRTAISEYALLYSTKKQVSESSGMQAFYDSGVAYVNIAFDEPNLFKYLYMSEDSGYVIDGIGFNASSVKENKVDLAEQVAIHLGISNEQASAFCKNMIIYTHGLASYVASGLLITTKQQVHEMMIQAAEGFLLQIGAQFPKDYSRIKNEQHYTSE